MTAGSVVVESYRDVTAHALRSALSALGLFVAVLSLTGIVAVSAVTADVQLAKDEQLTGRGTTEAVAVPAAAVQAAGLLALAERLGGTAAAGGGHYAVTAQLAGRVEAGGRQREATVVLTAGNLAGVRRLPVLAGAWYGPAGAVHQPVVVNQAAAAQLSHRTDLRLTLDPMHAAVPAEVVGIVADGSAAPVYYSPAASALRWDPGLLHGHGCMLFLQASSAAEPVLREALTDVLDRASIDPGTLEISRADSAGDLAAGIASTRRGFLIVCSATLLVSVLGLLNVGLASVRERRREIAIRRALGATRAGVFAIVCGSAALVGLAAAAAAVGLGVALLHPVVGHFLDPADAIAIPGYPWGAGVLGVAAALAASVLGAIVPAVAAARADLATLVK